MHSRNPDLSMRSITVSEEHLIGLDLTELENKDKALDKINKIDLMSLAVVV